MFKQKLTLDVAAYYQANNGVCGFSYTDALLCIGSCFAENMGERLVERAAGLNLDAPVHVGPGGHGQDNRERSAGAKQAGH